MLVRSIAPFLLVAALLGSGCALASSSDDVAVLGATLDRHPHRASITVDGVTDEFAVECTLTDTTVRAVATSSEAVFNFDGKRDASRVSISGFSSRFPDGFSASESTSDDVEVDLSGQVLSGRFIGIGDAEYSEVRFRIDCS